MNKHDCINDQDLILYYYEEPSAADKQQHLASCSACRQRLDVLARDLDRLPTLSCEPDDLAGVRMAARVTEKIRQPKRRLWLPAIGATAAAALVLVISFTSSPPPEIKQVPQVQPVPITAIELSDSMPDIEFLENLELISDLELLAQLEGV